MTASCGDDPVVCIDFVFLFIGEFLKDWTTLAMLALLLGLLLKLRADQKQTAADAYAEQMKAYARKREEESGTGQTWADKKTTAKARLKPGSD